MRHDIAFDLDGTLVDLLSVVKTIIIERHGVEFLPQEGFRLKTNPEIDSSLIWKAFDTAYRMIDEIKPMPGAQELLTRIYDVSKSPVVIVTARPLWAAHETHKLVKKLFDIPAFIAITNAHDKKIDYLSDINYFVDDRRATAKMLAEAGKRVFVPRYEYNAGMDHIPEVAYISNVGELISAIDLFVKG